MICVMDCSNGWNKAKKALETSPRRRMMARRGANSWRGTKATKDGQVGVGEGNDPRRRQKPLYATPEPFFNSLLVVGRSPLCDGFIWRCLEARGRSREEFVDLVSRQNILDDEKVAESFDKAKTGISGNFRAGRSVKGH